MGCCGVCVPGRRDGFEQGFDYFGYNPCVPKRDCCPKAEATVKCIINPGCQEGPVRLHITGTFAALGTQKCFKLFMCPNTVENVNTKPVYLVDDGGRCLPFTQAHTGNIIHFDQVCQVVDIHRKRRRREIVLECFLGSDGPHENALHVVCRTKLPNTTFVPRPDLEGPIEGGGFADGFRG